MTRAGSRLAASALRTILAAPIVWMVLGALLVTYAVGTGLVISYAVSRGQAGIAPRAPVPDQIAAVYEGATTLTGDARSIYLRGVNGAGVKVVVWSALTPPKHEPDLLRNAWDRGIQARIAQFVDPSLQAYVEAGVVARLRRTDLLLRSAETVAYLPAPDGQTVEIRIADSGLGRLASLWTIVGLAAIAAILCAFALSLTRRVLLPLSRISDAAERLGDDLAAPPMAASGFGEMRRVAGAFNLMQQRLRALIDERTRLLSGIGHDLRNTLTRLRLRLEDLPDAAARRKAQAEVDFMVKVLEEHMDFARAGDLAEEKTLFDVALLVQDLVDDRIEAGETASYEGPDRLTLVGRPAALRRAIANVVENAVHYGGCAEVSVEASEGGVVVRVADRGPGVPEAERESIFEPFRRRAPEAAVGGDDHFGLGLATARMIVAGHGGAITLEDRAGGGAVFTLSLPNPPG